MLEVELWGILDELKLIPNRRLESVLIQTDSIEATTAIQEGVFRILNTTIIRRIHQTLTNVKQRKIQHILREENTVANNLVKIIRDRRLGLRLFEDTPSRV
ncbi:hypothetical protein Goshw_002158 [Gossypium schwendimanii]|uniref:RNase H type-1 domain-containing protein n=1 Tax=Gossypium schwendimanii TaxID=34291 RepID=A0A7J9MWV1_GOSSC|nr:hypothetical protein [Gossypium schwendimanii]